MGCKSHLAKERGDAGDDLRLALRRQVVEVEGELGLPVPHRVRHAGRQRGDGCDGVRPWWSTTARIGGKVPDPS